MFRSSNVTLRVALVFVTQLIGFYPLLNSQLVPFTIRILSKRPRKFECTQDTRWNLATIETLNDQNKNVNGYKQPTNAQRKASTQLPNYKITQ